MQPANTRFAASAVDLKILPVNSRVGMNSTHYVFTTYAGQQHAFMQHALAVNSLRPLLGQVLCGVNTLPHRRIDWVPCRSVCNLHVSPT